MENLFLVEKIFLLGRMRSKGGGIDIQGDGHTGVDGNTRGMDREKGRTQKDEQS